VAAVILFPSPRRDPSPKNAVRSVQLRVQDIQAADERMIAIYRHWRAAADAGRGIPTRKELDLIDHLDLFKPLMGWTHILDCGAEDPGEYFFRLYGSHSTIFDSKNFTQSRLAQIPCPIYRKEVTGDYHQVKVTGTPSLHLMKMRLNWYTTSYSRMVLPLSHNRRDISQLLVTINRRPVPELGELPW
jgi:hypothetical protein